MAKCYALSHEASTVVAVLVIETHDRGGEPRQSDRLLLDGLFWVPCSGTAWRDMLDRFGP